MQMLQYLFWPNPVSATYGDPKVLALLGLCAALIIGSFVLSFWRRKQSNPMTRKLSASWPRAALWFGVIGLVLVVSRVESIQFFAMRFLWVLWAVCILLFLLFQAKRWRTRHYELLPTVVTHDPRDKYLPRKKRK
jgi:hypothetical protein